MLLYSTPSKLWWTFASRGRSKLTLHELRMQTDITMMVDIHQCSDLSACWPGLANIRVNLRIVNRHDGMSRKSLLQEPNLQVSRSLSQPITTLNHIYHLLSRLTVSRCTSLTCRKSSCNEKFEPQFDEEPQCIHIETATYQADTTLHGRTHRVPPHPIWRSREWLIQKPWPNPPDASAVTSSEFRIEDKAEHLSCWRNHFDPKEILLRFDIFNSHPEYHISTDSET